MYPSLFSLTPYFFPPFPPSWPASLPPFWWSLLILSGFLKSFPEPSFFCSCVFKAQTISLFLYLSIYLFIYLSVCLPIYLFSIYLSIYISLGCHLPNLIHFLYIYIFQVTNKKNSIKYITDASHKHTPTFFYPIRLYNNVTNSPVVLEISFKVEAVTSRSKWNTWKTLTVNFFFRNLDQRGEGNVLCWRKKNTTNGAVRKEVWLI